MSHIRKLRGGDWIGRSEPFIANKMSEKKRSYAVWNGPDYMTVAGAAILAAKITAFWRDNAPINSKTVLCTIETERFGASMRGPIEQFCCVRSNLVNGLPRL